VVEAVSKGKGLRGCEKIGPTDVKV
jgi:hypothetical protein